MQLYIIRHAQSTNNALADEKDRTYDPPLTDLGTRQAELVAGFLASGLPLDERFFPGKSLNGSTPRGFGITRLYCSPMLRTLRTAQPISEALGIAPEVWVDIHEHGGLYLEHTDERGIIGFPGLTRREFAEQFAHYVLPDAVTDQGWWDPANGMESEEASMERATTVAAVLREQAASQERIAIITHGTFANHLIKAIFDQLPGRRLYYYHYNTAVSRIDFYDNGWLALAYLNRVDHLPPELISA